MQKSKFEKSLRRRFASYIFPYTEYDRSVGNKGNILSASDEAKIKEELINLALRAFDKAAKQSMHSDTGDSAL